MTRKLMTALCLLLLVMVTWSWGQSFLAADSLAVPVVSQNQLFARHAHGAFTLGVPKLGLMLAMPHWIAAGTLGVWVLMNLRIELKGHRAAKK